MMHAAFAAAMATASQRHQLVAAVLIHAPDSLDLLRLAEVRLV